MPFLIAAIFIDAVGLGIIYPVLTPVIAEDSLGLLTGVPLSTREVILGATLAAYALGMFFGAPVLGALSDRYGRKPIRVVSLLGTAGGFAIGAGGLLVRSILMVSRDAMAFVVAVPWALGGSIAYIAVATLYSQAVGADQQGSIIGLVGGVFALTWVIGPILGGFLEGYGVLLPGLVGAALSIGGAAILAVRRPRPAPVAAASSAA